MRETKTLTFQVKALGIVTDESGQEFGQIEAYGAILNNTDEGNDRIIPGAFNRTIKNSKARAQKREKKYILPMLWVHQDAELIGSWHDLIEDAEGLLGKGDVALATQRGREYYALAKAGMADQFSIIYDIPQGGARYDKSGVRELTEIRLFSMDPVTFAMNDETKLVGVKSASGKTSWPLADKDTPWDAGQAKKDCQAWAGDEKGKLAQCCFWVAKSPPEKLGDCKLFFVGSVNGEMKAVPHGIISAAGVIQGAMGGADIDDVTGVKKKIATYYKKMDMTPPWESDDKSMPKTTEKKDFNSLYMDAQAADALEDWGDLVNALTGAMMQAFCIGDSAISDMSDAIDQFKEACMKWCAVAQECSMSDYLSDRGYSGSNSPYVPYSLRVGDNYSYMSRRTPQAVKAGAMFSAANAKAIQAHIDTLHDIADAHTKAAKAHTSALQSAADDLATVLQGSEAAYGSDHGTPAQGQQEGGKARSFPTPSTQTPHSSSDDTVDEQAITLALSQLHAIKAK